MRYKYRYLTESRFSPAVGWHFFKMRAVPCDNVFQRVTSSRLAVLPACTLCQSVDGQGNVVHWGSIEPRHDAFRVESVGEVELLSPYVLHESPAPYYLTPTRLTTCSSSMTAFARSIAAQARGDASSSAPFTLAEALMHAVHAHITYTPCHTTTATTATEVWADPRGVCQDFAHLLVALCRAAGIHARYVNGLIPGDGQTHAWVEVSDGESWLPFDPTHDIQPQWGYIKLAHGRDADDCPTLRGRFYGWTSEAMTVAVSVSSPIDCEPANKSNLK